MQGLYSLSGRMSYGKISRSLEAARYGFKHFSSLWNLTGTSAAPLPKCLLNFRAIRSLSHPISRLRDFARFGGKTSYRLVNRGPVSLEINHWIVHCSTPVGAPFCPHVPFCPDLLYHLGSAGSSSFIFNVRNLEMADTLLATFSNVFIEWKLLYMDSRFT